ncbi:MAG: hypothetical protein KC620_06565 [Myxococcales bacterium]|nr:hypothetical protein [Myxococcales bacterium]
MTHLADLEGATTLNGAPLSDLALAHAALPAAASMTTVDEVHRRARPVGDEARMGDILFFDGAGGAPELAVVVDVNDDGVLEALAVIRGAVRRVKIDRAHPHSRRHKGRVVNSFLRVRRRDDEPQAAYLAGQLLREVRSLQD